MQLTQAEKKKLKELADGIADYVLFHVVDYSYLKNFKYRGYFCIQINKNEYFVRNINFKVDIAKSTYLIKRKFPDINKVVEVNSKVGVDFSELVDVIDLYTYVDKWTDRIRRTDLIISFIDKYTNGEKEWYSFAFDENSDFEDFYKFVLNKFFKFPFKRLDPFIDYFNKLMIKTAKNG